MLGIVLKLKGDGCWPDLAHKEILHLGNDAPSIEMAPLVGGMPSGKTSVTIRLDLPDNKVVLAETSLELLSAAVRTIEASTVENNAREIWENPRN